MPFFVNEYTTYLITFHTFLNFKKMKTLLCNYLAFLLVAEGLNLTPGQLFNLSTFDLQLPVSSGGGGVEVIKSDALMKGYTSEYFYTDPIDQSNRWSSSAQRMAHTLLGLIFLEVSFDKIQILPSRLVDDTCLM